MASPKVKRKSGNPSQRGKPQKPIQVIVRNNPRPRALVTRAKDIPGSLLSGTGRVGLLHQGEPEMVIPLLPGWSGIPSLDIRARSTGWSRWNNPPTLNFRSLTGSGSEAVVLVKIVQAVSWLQALNKPDLLTVDSDCYTFKACENFTLKLSAVRGSAEALNPFNTENLLTFISLKVLSPDLMVGELSLDYSVKFGGRPLKPISPTFVHVGKDLTLTNGTSDVAHPQQGRLTFDRPGPYELTFINKDGKGIAAPVFAKMLGDSSPDVALMEVNRSPQPPTATGTMKDRIISALINVGERGFLTLIDKWGSGRSAGEGIAPTPDNPPPAETTTENFEGTVIISSPGAATRVNSSQPSGPAVVVVDPRSRTAGGKVLWVLGEVATQVAWSLASTLVQSFVQGITRTGALHRGSQATNYIRWLNHSPSVAPDLPHEDIPGGETHVPDIPDFNGDPDAPGVTTDWVGTQQYMSVYARHRPYSKADWRGNTYCKGYAATKFKNATYFLPPRLVGPSYRRAIWDKEDKLYIASNLRVDSALDGAYLLMESYTWGDNTCSRFSEYMPAEAAVYYGSVMYFSGLTCCRSVIRIVNADLFSRLADNVLMGMSQLPYEAKSSNPGYAYSLHPRLADAVERGDKDVVPEVRAPGGPGYLPGPDIPQLGPHIKPPSGWSSFLGTTTASGSFSTGLSSDPLKPVCPFKPTGSSRIPLPKILANGLPTMAAMLPELAVTGALVAVFGIIAGVCVDMFDVEDCAALNTIRLSAVSSGKVAKSFLANWLKGDSFTRLRKLSLATQDAGEYGLTLPMHTDIPNQHATRAAPIPSGASNHPGFPWGWAPEKPEYCGSQDGSDLFFYPDGVYAPGGRWKPGTGPNADSGNSDDVDYAPGTGGDAPPTPETPPAITDSEIVHYELDPISPGFAENYKAITSRRTMARSELPVRLEAGPIRFVIGSAVDRTNNWYQSAGDANVLDYDVYMTQTSIACEWTWQGGLQGADSGVVALNNESKIPDAGATGPNAQKYWMEDGTYGRVITMIPPSRFANKDNFLCVEIVAQNTVSSNIKFSVPGYTGCEPKVTCRTRGPVVFLRAYGPMDTFSKIHLVVPYDTSRAGCFMLGASDHIYVHATATCYIVGSEKVAKRWTLFDDENADAYTGTSANIKMYEMRPEGFDVEAPKGLYDLPGNLETQFCFSAYKDGQVMPSCNKVLPPGLEMLPTSRRVSRGNISWLPNQDDGHSETPPKPNPPLTPPAMKPNEIIPPTPDATTEGGFHETVTLLQDKPIVPERAQAAPVVHTTTTIKRTQPGIVTTDAITGFTANSLINFHDDRGLVPYSTNTRTTYVGRIVDHARRFPIYVGLPQLEITGPLAEPPKLTIIEVFKVGSIAWRGQDRLTAYAGYTTLDLLDLGDYNISGAPVPISAHNERHYGHTSKFRLRRCKIFTSAFMNQRGAMDLDDPNRLGRYAISNRANIILVARQVDMTETTDLYSEVLSHWLEVDDFIDINEHISYTTTFGDFENILSATLKELPKMVEFTGTYYPMARTLAALEAHDLEDHTNGGAWKIETYLDAQPLESKGFSETPIQTNEANKQSTVSGINSVEQKLEPTTPAPDDGTPSSGLNPAVPSTPTHIPAAADNYIE